MKKSIKALFVSFLKLEKLNKRKVFEFHYKVNVANFSSSGKTLKVARVAEKIKCWSLGKDASHVIVIIINLSQGGHNVKTTVTNTTSLCIANHFRNTADY